MPAHEEQIIGWRAIGDFLRTWLPVLSGSGFAAFIAFLAAFHRRVWGWARPAWLAVAQPRKLARENADARTSLREVKEQLVMASDSAKYWQTSHEELLARYNDLSTRFDRLKDEAHEAKESAVAAEARAEDLEKQVSVAISEIGEMVMITERRSKLLGLLIDNQGTLQKAWQAQCEFITRVRAYVPDAFIHELEALLVPPSLADIESLAAEVSSKEHRDS